MNNEVVDRDGGDGGGGFNDDGAHVVAHSTLEVREGSRYFDDPAAIAVRQGYRRRR